MGLGYFSPEMRSDQDRSDRWPRTEVTKFSKSLMVSIHGYFISRLFGIVPCWFFCCIWHQSQWVLLSGHRTHRTQNITWLLYRI